VSRSAPNLRSTDSAAVRRCLAERRCVMHPGGPHRHRSDGGGNRSTMFVRCSYRRGLLRRPWAACK